jgi:hypothetical protein
MQINLEIKKYSFAEKPSQILSTLGFESAKNYTLNDGILSFEDDRTQADVESLLNSSAKLLYLNQDFLKNKLEADYNSAKKIILQNGNTLTIEHNTPERGIFTSHLETAKRVEKAENSVLSYHQQVGDVMLGFSALAYIWNYLFFKKFTNERPSLTLEDKRGKNKEIYDINKLKIENSNSIEELQAITWSFEDITLIKINEEAQKLLDDPKTPAYVIDAINALKDTQGQIHLIEQL